MIKNLLFDLGGVIMDIDKNLCIEAFERLGLPDARSYFGDYSQKGPFKLIEEGAMTPDEFHDILRRDIGKNVSDSMIDSAFCDFLIGIPAHRLEELRRLRRNYRIYLLSNTNRIMWTTKIREEFKKEGLEREDYFDGIVTSYEARALKPDSRIFEFAIHTLGIKPDETIFLDDSRRNLDAAAGLGFHTLLVEPGSEFSELLANEHIS